MGELTLENITKWSYIDELFEKQGEQKPDDKIEPTDYNSIDPHFGKPIDKVEPKFKVGDWVVSDDKDVHDDYRVCKITKIVDGRYYIEGGDFISESSLAQYEYRLWTIQDAKDGDVLCYKDEISLYKHDIKNCTKQEITFGGFVYHCCYDGKKFITDSLYSLTEQDKIDIHLATKEQRDLLFQKMKDAGYEWDAEKKELKKISQRTISAEAKEAMYDKSTNEEMIETLRTEYEKGRADAIAEMQKGWSEEDEERIKNIISFLDWDGATGKKGNPYQKEIDWLKSLKDRCTWKPTKEKMKALHDINLTGNISYAGQGQELINLYNDLKKL